VPEKPLKAHVESWCIALPSQPSLHDFFKKHRQLLPIPSITPGCSAVHQAQGGGGKLQEMGVGPPRMWYFAEVFAHLRYL
jgi:hypothetical protein